MAEDQAPLRRAPLRRAPTMRDVSRLAGVSPMTVSRTLSQAALVSEETRARVLAAVERLGYVPDRGAGDCRRGAPASSP